MAATRGHGNPNWTREEVILALDLYFDCRGRIPGAADARVQSLSNVLRAFPHHSFATRQESFRNPDGVAFKLQNLHKIATGKGFGNISRIDRAVWDELQSSPERVKELASLIKAGIRVLHQVQEDAQDYEVFAEGNVVTKAHLRRERNRKLRMRLIERRAKAGILSCDLCGRSSEGLSAAFSHTIFEAHHIIPLAIDGARTTKLSDMALLCACCHRLIHKVIASQGRWLGLRDAKAIIYES